MDQLLTGSARGGRDTDHHRSHQVIRTVFYTPGLHHTTLTQVGMGSEPSSSRGLLLLHVFFGITPRTVCLSVVLISKAALRHGSLFKALYK